MSKLWRTLRILVIVGAVIGILALEVYQRTRSDRVTRKNEPEFVKEVIYDLPIQDAIALGKYVWVSRSLTDQNFPPAEHESGRKHLRFKLYYFDRHVNSEQVVARMQEDDMRPATLREFLAFAHTENLGEYSIGTLNSRWMDPQCDQILVASLESAYLKPPTFRERRLYLRQYYGRWYPSCRFLAVAK